MLGAGPLRLQEQSAPALIQAFQRHIDLMLISCQMSRLPVSVMAQEMSQVFACTETEVDLTYDLRRLSEILSIIV